MESASEAQFLIYYSTTYSGIETGGGSGKQKSVQRRKVPILKVAKKSYIPAITKGATNIRKISSVTRNTLSYIFGM